MNRLTITIDVFGEGSEMSPHELQQALFTVANAYRAEYQRKLEAECERVLNEAIDEAVVVIGVDAAPSNE